MRLSRRPSSSATASRKFIADQPPSSASCATISVDLLRQRGVLLPLRRHDVVGGLRQESLVRELRRSSAPASVPISSRCLRQAGALRLRVEEPAAADGRTRRRASAWSSRRACPRAASTTANGVTPARRWIRSDSDSTAGRPHAGHGGRRLELHRRRDAVLASGTAGSPVTMSWTRANAASASASTSLRALLRPRRDRRSTRPDPEPLPDLLGDERHDRVEQPQRALQDPGEHAARRPARSAPSPSSRPFCISRPQSQNSDQRNRKIAWAASANRYASSAASTSARHAWWRESSQRSGTVSRSAGGSSGSPPG